MPIINVLDKSIYNRISAGEVVERPASVVKELVENSIDAKATEIKIRIYGGGIDKIEVFDNGGGIEKEDLKTALMPHATSKIAKKEDLDSILTLGFRGEALPSICAVSEIRITSKKSDYEIGYTLTSTGGEIGEIEESPCNNGTFITVSNLFYNTPARRKFLKSTKGEENEVSDMVLRLILGNPNIAFEYFVDGEEIYKTFGDGVLDSLIACYGTEYYNNSFQINNYVHGIKIEGYISKHNFTKPNRTYQTIILNGRYIVNQTIQSAIHNAYSSYLMKRRYPFYVLYITMPNEVVDVNVNPNKSDVRFMDNSVVYGAIYSTISKVLDGSDVALDIVSKNETVFNPPNLIDKELNKKSEESIVVNNDSFYKSKKYENDDFSDYFAGVKVAENKNLYETQSQLSRAPKKEEDVFSANKKYIEELERKKKEQEFEQLELKSSLELTYVGQVLNSYLIFEDGKDMFLVDQHAAHERLLYNKILNLYSLKQLTVQPMLIPYEFSINSKEEEYFEPKISYLKDLGIEIKQVGKGEYYVNSIPIELIDINLNEFFMDIISDNSLKNQTIPDIINEKLITKACKSAIKANTPLSESEVKSLIRLLNGDINLKCPHGRPIAVRIKKYEIDKWFKRIV